MTTLDTGSRKKFEQALKWCDDMRADQVIGLQIQDLQSLSRRELAEVVQSAWQAGREELLSLVRDQYEILEALRLSVEWEIAPTIMKKIAEVCERARVGELIGKDGE
jgi:hypothetical protein